MFHSARHPKPYIFHHHSQRSTLPFRPPLTLSRIPLIDEDKSCSSESDSCNQIDAAALVSLYEGKF